MAESREDQPQDQLQLTSSTALETTQNTDLVCGVARSHVESFLILIRDNYKKADKATFFLEQRSGIVNIQGITNMRDVLSHLVTLLDTATPSDKWEEQLGNAEEHLRRAIIEPYEIALNELTVKFEELYDKYKQQVLPIKDKHTVLQNAPNSVSIEATLQEIREYTSVGRFGKAKNLWNPEWEEGVTSFIAAYDGLSNLYSSLETHWNNYEQIRRDIKSTRFHITAIAIGIVGILIAVLLVVFPSWGERIRELFGL
jgi:hypothetical protein